MSYDSFTRVFSSWVLSGHGRGLHHGPNHQYQWWGLYLALLLPTKFSCLSLVLLIKPDILYSAKLNFDLMAEP